MSTELEDIDKQTETADGSAPASEFESVAGATGAEGRSSTDTTVFAIAALITLAIIGWGVFATDSLTNRTLDAQVWLIENLGWLFVISASAFVVFALWMAFSKYGRIPLGKDDEKPEFRTVSWVAMMFSAGMGIGLMFFGVAEPLGHFISPAPDLAKLNPDAEDRLRSAMSTTLFHWTLHAWAIYAVVGLAIAYGSFRRGRRQLISSVFAPLLGERRTNGAVGKAIDILAIFATLFGSAASLGIGAIQIGNGMVAVNWVGDVGISVLVVIIGVLTVCFVASAVSGVAKGIQWLSNINMVLALVLAIFVFAVGPTVFILNLIPTSIGEYFRDLPSLAARTEATGGAEMAEWLGGMTIFYWAWWISWTPFVGMFIARISRGRTIKQFVGGVILVPSVVSLLWFAVFGGNAINIQRSGTDLTEDGNAGEEVQTFTMFQDMPWEVITSVIVMVLVAIFFVSGADAASVVMGTLSQKGSIHPGRTVVIIWGVLTGAIAAIMLMIGDGKENALDGLQQLTILAAAPFVVIMIGLCVALAKDLRNDPLVRREDKGAEVVEQAVLHGTRRYGEKFRLEVAAAGSLRSPAEPKRRRRRPEETPPEES